MNLEPICEYYQVNWSLILSCKVKSRDNSLVNIGFLFCCVNHVISAIYLFIYFFPLQVVSVTIFPGFTLPGELVFYFVVESCDQCNIFIYIFFSFANCM